MPWFLKAAPHRTGTASIDRVAFLRAVFISDSEISSPLRYFSIKWSSSSARDSISLDRQRKASCSNSFGMEISLKSTPRLCSSHTIPFNRIRSTIPINRSSFPIGIWMIKGLAPRRSMIIFTVPKKFAPIRSILLTKANLGTRYLSA